jgi:tripartite-type tricarboxylate transporter receptor subunit TctC
MKTSLRPAATPSPQRRSRPRVNDRPYPKTRPSGQHPRRRFLGLAAGAAAVPAASRIAWAQSYPTRPITMIVPFPAGGGLDSVGRIVAERMRALIGQPVVIENVSGADGSIGVGRAARARPDGYTIVLSSISAHVLNGAFYSLPYDLMNDFTPIAPLVKSTPIIVGRKTFPAKDLGELIAWLKANPNKASMAVPFLGARLLATLLQQQTGTQFTLVPYRGGGPALQDLVAGQIDLVIDFPLICLPLMRAGSIKAYAVTSDVRVRVMPDISTFAEVALPLLSYEDWLGFFPPKSTPRAIIDKLNAVVIEASSDSVVRSRIHEFGSEIFPRDQQTPEGLAAMQKAGAEKWWPIMKAAGIKAE